MTGASLTGASLTGTVAREWPVGHVPATHPQASVDPDPICRVPIFPL
ncbi:MAG: hypothetical protein ACK5WR_20740 [Planctomycetaceae bacterium]